MFASASPTAVRLSLAVLSILPEFAASTQRPTVENDAITRLALALRPCVAGPYALLHARFARRMHFKLNGLTAPDQKRIRFRTMVPNRAACC